MKGSSFKAKHEIDHPIDKKHAINVEKTGDHFYDYIGRYCNSDATKQLHLVPKQITDEGENVHDLSSEPIVITEEPRDNKRLK
jgi:hypothetical protein